jgi:NAD(P)H-flavin reductase
VTVTDDRTGRDDRHELDAFTPRSWRIVDRRDDCPEVATLFLRPVEDDLPSFLPAQFSMLGLPGVGEVPISISTSTRETDHHGYTIRRSGVVTNRLLDRRVGDVVTLRGPFGRAWDLDAAVGGDVVVVAGGIGIAPLRAVVHHLVDHRDRFGRVAVLVGALEPRVLVYGDWLRSLADHGVDVRLTVDRSSPDDGWDGPVGLVTALLADVVAGPDVTALVCGPDPMMRATIAGLGGLGVPPERIQLTLERNMHCGAGWCGHCQLGKLLVCRDGPVATAAELAGALDVKGL